MENELKKLLIKHIDLAAELSDLLSKDPEDKFARCTSLILEALNLIN